MKKLLVLMLVLGMASLANATVIDVVTLGLGSLGHAGTSTDWLVEGETIEIGLVLNYNQVPSQPPRDGYILSMMDVDLHLSGPGTLDVGYWAYGNPYFQYHSNFSLFGVVDAYSSTEWDSVGDGLDQIAGAATTPILGTEGTGPGSLGTLLLWDLIIECTGEGNIIIDLTLNGLSEYAPYTNINGKLPKPDPPGWVVMVEGDLGDLVIHNIPEPATVALLGLGGLFLLRRKK